MYLRPDLSTFRILPWTQGTGERIGRLICDIYNPDGTPFAGCPRHALKRAIARAAERRLRDERGAGSRVLPLPDAGRRADHRDARRGRLLRPGAGRPRRGRAPADRAGARDHGLEVEAAHHEVAAGPARDRLPLRRCAGRRRTTSARSASSSRTSRSRTACTRRSCRSRSTASTARACTRTSRSSPRTATRSSMSTRRGN